VLVVILGDAILWLMAAWYGGAWVSRSEVPQFPNRGSLTVALLLVGLMPFLAAALTGSRNALFLIVGGVFLVAAISIMFQPEQQPPGLGTKRGASAKERFLTTAGLATIIMIILVK